MTYGDRINALLTPAERRVFERLNSPHRIQNFLDTLPINFEMRGETYMSPRRTLQARTAHCFEGALLAAAAMAYHGQKPLLMDFRTPLDEDHVVALFQVNGHWGAISKTNHAILRYRDAVYRTPRELALAYFHEYIDNRGRKILTEYSAPFDLSRYEPEAWVIHEEELVTLVDAVEDARHFPVASKENLASLRKVDDIEYNSMLKTEWHAPRGYPRS